MACVHASGSLLEFHSGFTPGGSFLEKKAWLVCPCSRGVEDSVTC